ncbi:hypothetical protein FPZ43_11630 [Mucilaginibacter pallidiroseus]|uniref:Uncharacterized protein n=1 Tax=Mucilaginibacter pallidiroseus TaxID=2599295 RepID=A0A563UCC7_9SPHI|nr:hypothetical protein [Mucilaginibacter pallidiroseus]TWR28909.1 hypothetical protein FPZ43_11630 [Mucilaginibacter pallidiroseus]
MKKLVIAILFIVSAQNTFAQTKQEVLKIFWPEEYKWKIGSNQKSGTQQMVELIPGNETLQNW